MAINQIRNEVGDIVLVGVGDFSDRPNDIGMYRTKTALDAMIRMGYDAVTLGERELSMGVTFLKENVDMERLPVVTTNLYYDGERFGKPYLILEKNGIRIGIVSALMELTSKYSKIWEIRDPVEELRKVLPELEKQCDVIIALAHLGFTKSFDLADVFHRIDVIIAGHGSRKTADPTPVGDAILVKAGNQGKWLGRLDLVLGEERGEVNSYEGHLITLGPKVDSDPAMLELYTTFEDSLKKIQQRQGSVQTSSPFEEALHRDYRGSRWCRSCHVREFNAWVRTDHSRAFQRLKSEGNVDDEDCLACHTTGYGDGGFTDLEETAFLANVGCESCHGPGKEHIDSKGEARTVRIVAETCTRCHDDEWDPEFNFERKKAFVH